MLDGLSSSDMVDLFQKMTIDLKDIHFPKKTISITPYDKPWITEELKVIRRRRQRIYRKEGRSIAYLNLKDEFDNKLKLEAAKYVKKLNEEVSSGKRGSSYAAIRKLGNRDFAESKGRETFDVPEFLDNNFDDNQSAEALADFFSSISQEFQPVDVNNFSSNIKDELERGRAETKLPLLNEFKVYSKISRAKIPHSSVPGDLKRVLIKEYSPELVTSVTMIYKKLTETKEFPRSWVVEQQFQNQTLLHPSMT